MKREKGITLAGLLLALGMACTSTAGVSVTGGLTYEHQLLPGETGRGTIHLRNTEPHHQAVSIYQTDYFHYCDGSTIYGEAGQDSRSNADWITFSPRRLTIPPNGTARVHYAVTVPDNETLAGTYWSMMMIEGIASSPSIVTGDENTVGIRHLIRYGAQIRTRIGNTGTRKLKFLHAKLLNAGGESILQIDLENIGERFLTPLVWVELFHRKHGSAGKFEGGRLGIYPAASVRFRINLRRATQGVYKALVVADCGGDDLFGATYTLQFE
ncbi:MAG: hypothetical protein R6U50_03595 [Desulfobacterales bacterium]